MRRALLGLFAAILTAGALALSASASVAPDSPGPSVSRLRVWRLEDGRLAMDAGQPSDPAPVGSLQKPFVLKAWARAHPGLASPRVRCHAASGCWLRSGHGTVGLTHAAAVSCNTYFRTLAGDTPPGMLAETLREAGFTFSGLLDTDGAIGLARGPDGPAIGPEALLRAYVDLTRVPWTVGETLRQELLAGLRQAALTGTAAGLGRSGFWAKTGTVPSLDGRPLATSGWALAVDDSGWAVLASLTPGTGREAAAALAEPLARFRPWSLPHAGPVIPRSSQSPRSPRLPDPRSDLSSVHVRLLEMLRPRAVTARNRGGAPVSTSRGFVGSAGAVDLRPGDHLASGLWELSIESRHFTRVVSAALEVDSAPDGTLLVHAAMSPREYVSGVIAAELGESRSALREPLGAAVLRFLAAGPRHGSDDVCDSTHCAWFVGRGPALRWARPERATLLSRPTESSPAVDDDSWRRIQENARRPGPAQWTSHCGGRPLSAHSVWGNGDRSVLSCSRHGSGTSRPWTRHWSDEDLRRSFGPGVRDLAVEVVDGVWTLHVDAGAERRDLLYDDAHRLLASVLGWGALPSPADRVVRDATGYRAEGVGLGHRVGLCLAD